MAPSSCEDTAAATLQATVSADWLNYVRGSYQVYPGSELGTSTSLCLKTSPADEALWDLYRSLRLGRRSSRCVAEHHRAIDLSHTSAILDLKRGSVGYKVVTTQPRIWVTVVLPECKSIYRGIHLSPLSFNKIPNKERHTERYHAWLSKFRSDTGPKYHLFDREVQLSIAGSINQMCCLLTHFRGCLWQTSNMDSC